MHVRIPRTAETSERIEISRSREVCACITVSPSLHPNAICVYYCLLLLDSSVSSASARSRDLQTVCKRRQWGIHPRFGRAMSHCHELFTLGVRVRDEALHSKAGSLQATGLLNWTVIDSDSRRGGEEQIKLDRREGRSAAYAHRARLRVVSWPPLARSRGLPAGLLTLPLAQPPLLFSMSTSASDAAVLDVGDRWW